MTNHNALGNSELHEDKGISSANDRELYWADGAGSGSWKPLIYTTSHTVSSTETSIEFTDLGEFAFIQLDLFGIEKNTSTDHHILCQLGNNSGYTTSSIYYRHYWHSGGDDSEQYTGLTCGYFREDTGLVNSGINCATLFIANFNIARYTVATLGEHMLGTSTFTAAFADSVHFVREQKAYNKLRLVDTIGAAFTGGTVVLSGWRYYTS